MKKETDYQRYKCHMCGHIYDEALGDPLFNIPPGTKFDDLPESWFCSACGDPKESFVFHGRSEVRAENNMNDLHSKSEKIVVIGAGLAGWSIIEKLKIMNPNLNITLITADNGDYYYKPSLSESISKGVIKEDLIIASGKDRAENMGITLLSKVKVLGIEKENKELHTTKGVFSYTKLVLATGASPIQAFQRKFQQHMHYLNDINQYHLISEQLRSKKKYL